jgi:hypothetical protein
VQKIRYRRKELASFRISAVEGKRSVRLAIAADYVSTSLYDLEHEHPHLTDAARARFATLERPPSFTGVPDEVAIGVVALEIRDHSAIGFDWESWLEDELGAELGTKFTVVRRSAVRPRVADLPLTYPLRVLQVLPHTFPGLLLHDVFQTLFGSSDFHEAVEWNHCHAWDIRRFRTESQWPTAEILHFDHAPELTASELFDLTASWQTRLVVMATTKSSQLTPLAAALADLGGPAVLLCDEGVPTRFDLYAGIVHDQPLDYILEGLASRGKTRLFAGGGREELLRVSRIVETLTGDALRRAIAAEVPPPLVAPKRKLRSFRRVEPGVDALQSKEPSDTRRATDLLNDLLDQQKPALDRLSFDHERQGTLPSARLVREAQRRLRGAMRVNAPDPPQLRHVNAFLCSADDHEREPLAAESAVVQPGEPVHLAIQIGPRALELRTIGSTAFLEEAVLWRENERETELEVGVTPLDFELLGAPVQPLRLPRTGPSDIATFTLVPKEKSWVAGVARLRFCLYHRSTLIQSFRVAVALGPQQPDPSKLGEQFALALDLRPEDKPSVAGVQGGYFTRLEYSAFDFEAAERITPRRLSFFVNDSAGQVVVTVKGVELFSAQIAGGVPGRVQALRETLKRVSYATRADGTLTNDYRFLNGGKLNEGSPQDFAAALCQLASDGWELFNALVPSSREREGVAKSLDDTPGIVHAGQLDLKSVVPWGLVYLRNYDAAGAPPVACSAPLEDSTITNCGTQPSCPMYQEPGDTAKPVRSKNVACPRLFLGFRHMIEVPVQQEERFLKDADGQAASRTMPATISHSGTIRTLFGYNAGLVLAQKHLTALKNAKVPQLAFDPDPLHEREALVDALEAATAEVVYLYCHALESFEDPVSKQKLLAHLLIEDGKAIAGRITPGNRGSARFANHPLVFLNGCGTVGFTPYAPAEFIRTLVQGCGASAVIGTEATVWEGLATEMAQAFLESFIGDKKSAGEALFESRRALLKKGNPLGLAYTLYGPADLKLEPQPEKGDP